MSHGNEDTVREMLRIKRSVQATYNTQVIVVGVATRLGGYLNWWLLDLVASRAVVIM